MSIAIESFVGIEKSLVSKLTKTYKKLAANYRRQLLPLIAEQDWLGVTALVNTIDVTPVYDLNKGYITYSTYAAMIFGATRLTEDPQQTSMATIGNSKDVTRATELLKRTILVSVKRSMQESILAEVAKLKNEALYGVAKAERVLQPFQSFLKDGEEKLQLVSQLHTSRVSAFGYTAEAEVLGVTHYQISEQLDSRICSVCSYMNGKTFQVADARTTLNKVLDTVDPDQLKIIQPFPSQTVDDVKTYKTLTDAQLVANNWHIPPFHPSCRGLLVAARQIITILDTFTSSDVYGALYTEEDGKTKERNIANDPKQGDTRLHAIFDYLAYNRLPTLGSKKELDLAISLGGKELLRGVVSTATYTDTAMVEAFKTGVNYVGAGVFGNGTYALSFAKTTAKIKAAENALLQDDRLAITARALTTQKKEAQRVIDQYSDPTTNKGLMRMVLASDAKVLNYKDIDLFTDDQFTDLQDTVATITSKVVDRLSGTRLAGLTGTAYTDIVQEEVGKVVKANEATIQKLKVLFKDKSYYAALKGYDAIYVEHINYMVVLNRAKLLVQQEEVLFDDFLFGAIGR